MYIDENVLKGYLEDLKKFEALDKGGISKRFKEVENVFQAIGTTVEACEGEQRFPKAIWKDGVFQGIGDKDEFSREIFAPSKIDLTAGERYKGIKFQQDYFQRLINKGKWNVQYGDAEFVKNILSIIGGFDSRGKMKDEYRILSNAQTSKDDFDSTLQSNGQYAWINSHFADNTLFCEFVDFVKKCKKDQDAEINSSQDKEIKLEWHRNIALCYPFAEKEGNNFVGKLSRHKNTNETLVEKKEKETQSDIFKHRFPLKFLWMWANRDTVIHPLSLMAFREFLKSDFMKNILTKTKPQELVNSEIGDFVNKWKKLSEEIMKRLIRNYVADAPKNPHSPLK